MDKVITIKIEHCFECPFARIAVGEGDLVPMEARVWCHKGLFWVGSIKDSQEKSPRIGCPLEAKV